MANSNSRVVETLNRHESEVLTAWLERQLAAASLRRDLISERDLQDQSKQFLKSFQAALRSGETENIYASAWAETRGMLEDLSRKRSQQGFSPTETAMFVFSLKQPLFDLLRESGAANNVEMMDDVWTVSTLLDKLGLYTSEAFQQSREGVIARQQEEMLELSTPVVKLWDGILALPLIGTLDSQRTQVVMESLLQEIVSSGSGIAIIDITGVPLVDTLVAQHLLKTVAAARLMGADCIISGIRPQIAQTIVHLGVDLQNVMTKATLADAFLIALQRTGQMIVKKRQTDKPADENASNGL